MYRKISTRAEGKTTSLIKYVENNNPENAVIFVATEAEVKFMRECCRKICPDVDIDIKHSTQGAFIEALLREKDIYFDDIERCRFSKGNFGFTSTIQDSYENKERWNYRFNFEDKGE